MIQNSEDSTYGTRSPYSEGYIPGAFYFLLDGPVQDPPEATNLPTSDKVKDDTTA